MSACTVRARAKLNLTLEIIGTREDGYHLLRSVMQKIELADTLSLSSLPASAASHLITAEPTSCPQGRDNIVYTAVDAWTRATGSTGRFHVHIDKRIPLEAGLAGGSADAAAVLRVLNANAADNERLNDESLLALAAGIGADVPFCLSGVTSLCEGIGDAMTPLAPLPPLPVIVLKGLHPVSTKEAFSAWDRLPAKPLKDRAAHLAVPDALRTGITAAAVSDFNDFLPVQQPSSDYRLLQDAVRHLNPCFAGLSGSGPTFFLIFPNESTCEAGVRRLARMFSPERLIQTHLAVSV